MKLTALEIRKHEFTRAFRGYDAEEVDAFLNMIAQHWQTTKQDMARLEERLEEQTLRVNHYLKVEEALEAALDNAKVLSKDRLEAATTEADERVQSAKEQAEGTLSEAEQQAAEALNSAESKARQTLESAETQAAATVMSANERANAVLSDARSQMEEITALAEGARRSAREELARLEAERQRILSSLKELMEGGLASVTIYEDAVPPPEIVKFENAEPLVPVEALHQPVAMAAVLPEPAEPSGPKVLRLEEPDRPSLLEESTQTEPTQLAESFEADDDPVLSLSKPSQDDYLDDLPSADDVVNDEGSPASPAAKPEKEVPFAAKDEIKKIHRILEDLDN